jgi:hypothetical protein
MGPRTPATPNSYEAMSMINSDLTLELDTYPDPALAYELVDGSPVVRRVNETFSATFGEQSAETPVARTLDRIKAGNGPTDEIVTALEAGEHRDIRLRIAHSPSGPDGGAAEGPRTERYLVRSLPGSDTDSGHLLFVHVDEPVGPPAAPDDRDRLSTILGHDFRNLLDVATANLRAARERGDEERFERVASAHGRMERLLEDVLTLARGTEPIEPRGGVDLEGLVDTAWETIAPTDATLVIEEPLPVSTADPDHVTRLLENLFRNALDYANDAPTVSLGPLQDRDGFYVADDGPGIPSEDDEVVFEPGYTGSDGGSGLGLAIVNRIAVAHGWQVELTASADGGARFEITF